MLWEKKRRKNTFFVREIFSSTSCPAKNLTYSRFYLHVKSLLSSERTRKTDAQSIPISSRTGQLFKINKIGHDFLNRNKMTVVCSGVSLWMLSGTYNISSLGTRAQQPKTTTFAMLPSVYASSVSAQQYVRVGPCCTRPVGVCLRIFGVVVRTPILPSSPLTSSGRCRNRQFCHQFFPLKSQ